VNSDRGCSWALLEFIFFSLSPYFLNMGSNRDSTRVALTARLPSFFHLCIVALIF
jgi:hypothetical protein